MRPSQQYSSLSYSLMKSSKFLATILAVIFTSLSIAESTSAQQPAAKGAAQDIVSELAKKGFNTLVLAVDKAGLSEKLFTETLTLLAPTDNAFRDIPKAQLDALLADKEKLAAILSNHMIAGKLSSSELKSGKPTTLAGNALEFKSVDGKLKVNSATVVKPDMPASNGVIHGIDKLLLK